MAILVETLKGVRFALRPQHALSLPRSLRSASPNPAKVRAEQSPSLPTRPAPSWLLSLAWAMGLFAWSSCDRDTPLGSGGRRDAGTNGGLVTTTWDAGRIADAADARANLTCSKDGISYAVGDVVRLSDCTTCLCQASGQIGLCTGACPVDASSTSDGFPPLSRAELCTTSGGTVTTSTCCLSASDFPDSCMIGACSCGPGSTHSISVCMCKVGCFVPAAGCAGEPSVCSVGDDLSCNDASSATARGRCVTGGRCVCNADATLNASTSKCR